MSDFARSFSDALKQMHDRRAKICESCEFKSRDECLGWYWPDVSCPKGLPEEHSLQFVYHPSPHPSWVRKARKSKEKEAS